MDIKRLAKLFQLRKQATELGKSFAGAGGTLSSTSGYTTGANAANQAAQAPPAPENASAIRGIQDKEKAYFSGLDRGRPQAPKPLATEPVSDAQRAMNDLKAGFSQANKAGPTGPPPPKSPDVIPTNPQTGVPDRYYSLANGAPPDGTQAPAKPTAPASNELQRQFDAEDAQRKAQAEAEQAKAKELTNQQSFLASLGTSEKPQKPQFDDEDRSAPSKPAVPANIQKIWDRSYGAEDNAAATPKPETSYTTAQSRITYTDDYGRAQTIGRDQMEARKTDVAQSLAPAQPAIKPVPQPQHTTTEAFGKTVPILSVSGNMKPPEPAPRYSPPPVNMQAANRTAAKLSSPHIQKHSFLREAEIKKLVEDVSMPATCLLVLCLDEWGTELLDWEPQTLEQAARMTWNAELPQANRDKIWALVTHMTTDSFYSSLEAFIHICGALSGRGVDFEQFDPVEVDEMCWGITEAFLINPMEKEDRFCDDIVTYMETRLEYEGFQRVPHMLKKFVKLPAREEELNQTLTSDGIGFENYWKMQESRLANIDVWVRERLSALFMILENLPLRFANEQGLKRICERAKSTLVSQSDLKREVMAASR